MTIDLPKLIGPEAAHRLTHLGLDKVAAARLRAEGYKVAESLDLRTAIHVLGAKLYEKNAEAKMIFDGIRAYRSLRRS
jgi:hypothetical protein